MSIENLINNVLIRKYIFGYDYKLTKSEINGNCLYIYHGSKRKKLERRQKFRKKRKKKLKRKIRLCGTYKKMKRNSMRFTIQ